MRIVNSTQYDTRVLRTLVCAAHNDLAKAEGRLKCWPYLEVQFVYIRKEYTTRSISGYAYYYHGPVRIRVPKDSFDVAYAAALIQHELLHVYGYGHAAIGHTRTRFRKQNYQWAVEKLGTERLLPKPPAPSKPKPKRDLQRERYERLCEREKEWGTKLKRAQNALTKIQKQKRYYENQFKKAAERSNPDA